MKLTNYGRDVIIIVLVSTIAIDVVAFYINILWLKLALISISVLFFGFTLYFFRDPEREVPQGLNDNSILSAADGKVVLVDDIINEKIRCIRSWRKIETVEHFPFSFERSCK